MKKLTYLFVLLMLQSTLSIATPAKFKVTQEILDAINKEKSAVLRTNSNNHKHPITDDKSNNTQQTDNKRKRGRPPKIKLQQNLNNENIKESDNIQQTNKKRKPGRPPKIKPQQDLNDENIEIIQEQSREDSFENFDPEKLNTHFIYCFRNDIKRSDIHPGLRGNINGDTNEKFLFLEEDEDISHVDTNSYQDIAIAALVSIIVESSKN